MYIINILLYILFFLILIVKGNDYYELLGVSKDADDRSIRRAFKKLAIKYHPDKNKDDPDAHTKFVKINRAYEVLKDEELRKKYDQFGEEGLDNKFGIYDDDVEIVTLSHSDFQQSVIDSGEIWFVNFYSTFCSHCHDLAPTWREFAKEFENVIRIGAVNCAESPNFCGTQGIRGYPSLVLYPSGILYNGERDFKKLSDFVMNKIDTEVHKVTFKNYIPLSQEWSKYSNKPWIIDFCDDNESCLSKDNRKKLSAIFKNMINIGSVKCIEGDRDLLCKRIKESGVAYFPAKQIDKTMMQEIDTFDPKEIASIVLKFLPEIEELTLEEYNEFTNTKKEFISPYLVYFINTEEKNNNILHDMKKLPFIFSEIEFRIVKCNNLPDNCDSLYLDKSKNRFIMFKSNGRFEINYGKFSSIHELSIFIRESLKSDLTILTPETYQEALDDEENIWIIDYFAPWCGPCIRYIPVLRNLPNKIEGKVIQVGIIDCDVHKEICTNSGIQSYPTTVIYYNNNIFKQVGYHDLHQVIEFIQDSINPIVVELTVDNFEETINNRNEGTMAFVDFFAPWCGPCQQLAPEFRKLARSMVATYDNIIFGAVNCDDQKYLCQKFGISSYPSLKLFPSKTTLNPINYPPNWWRNHDSMMNFITRYIPSDVTSIGTEFYQLVLRSQTPALVDFFAPWCSHCIQFAPVFDRVAKRLKNKINIFKVDCDANPGICQAAAIQAYPTLRFYKGAKSGNQQHSFGLQLQTFDENLIVNWVEQQISTHDEL
ncbi:Dnajc10 protein [Strongyloides ratti]|uniref:DnaJ homolog subfamily C member 10 n=1 Tax=Strongyloides ratti TaxID=34506 RepID=A0A090LEQ0_STRRB|nr:Dnajc10 protein [Strongyloides ratti]CEF68202.1 Dnajc10 protein [Strongyloides ratti]